MVGKHCGKNRNCSLRAISPFPTVFSKDLYYGNVKAGLVWERVDLLPHDKFLGWPKLKQIADNILKCIQKENEVPYRVENIARKGEMACYTRFFLFSQCFPQLYIFSVSKCGIVW